MSYADGWPHLYSVPLAGGQALLLTPGPFMVEHASLTPDRRFIVYSANTGGDRLDADRRHLFKVPVDAASPAALTSGASVEWTPVVTSDGRFVVALGADAQQAAAADGRAARGRPASPRGCRSRARPIFPPRSSSRRSRRSSGRAMASRFTDRCSRPRVAPAKRPAVVYVHGGPPRQMLLGWHYMDYYSNDYAANQYLASRGFVVLSVNYRLGIGYGYAFHQPENAGARGASEYLDVLAGARYLQATSGRRCEPDRHLGWLVRRLSDSAGARAQLRHLLCRRGHSRRSQLGSSDVVDAESAPRPGGRRHHRWTMYSARRAWSTSRRRSRR